MLYFYGLNEDNYCTMMPKSFPNLLYYFNLITTYVFSFGIPFSAIAFANIVFVQSLLTRKTVGAQNEAHKKDEKSEQEKRKMQAERNYVIMLLFLTCSFSLFLIMGAVFYQYSKNYKLEEATFFLVLAENSLIMNNSLNFVFYYMSGQMFRTAFKTAWSKIFGGNANKRICDSRITAKS